MALGFCSLFGTMRPRLKCQKRNGKCHCCCPRFYYSKKTRRCEPYSSYRDEQCRRLETESRSCPHYSKANEIFSYGTRK